MLCAEVLRHLDRDDLAVEPPAVGDHEEGSRRPRGGDHLVRLGHARRHRFLDHHVLPVGQQRDRLRGVEGVRGRHDRRVHARVGRQPLDQRRRAVEAAGPPGEPAAGHAALDAGQLDHRPAAGGEVAVQGAQGPAGREGSLDGGEDGAVLRLEHEPVGGRARVPARAAVNESVELVKRARKSSAASLVNAVLRRAASEAKSPVERFLPSNLPLAERLAILHSHPTWLVEHWLARLRESATLALLEANNRTPRLACAVHDPPQRDAIIRELGTSGLRIEPGRLLKSAFAASGGSPARTEAFHTGKISIQDEASQLVAELVGVCPGDRVLDLCAAPGMKTSLLADDVGNGLLVACDSSARRLETLQKLLPRLTANTPAVRVVRLDATHPLPFRQKFDRILVDAPCSGTGTLARNPEIKWRLSVEDLERLRAIQRKILSNALSVLGPGGRLVYATCSLEPEENERVVESVLAGTADCRLLSRAELADELPKISPLIDARGYFHTRPDLHGMDGFFAAVIAR